MSKKILVIDDEPLFVDMLKVRLEHAGYKVVAAFDGQGGLHKAKSERPDLIILDVMLPSMDGYTVCRLLKFDETFRRIPIIMLTVRSQNSDKETGKAVGADAYIAKPYEAEVLINQIKRLLER
jgi:DNA-binding response OmpR family regulator